MKYMVEQLDAFIMRCSHCHAQTGGHPLRHYLGYMGSMSICSWKYEWGVWHKRRITADASTQVLTQLLLTGRQISCKLEGCMRIVTG